VKTTKVMTTTETRSTGSDEIDSSEDTTDTCKIISPNTHDPATLNSETIIKPMSVVASSRRDKDALRRIKIRLE